MSNFKSPKDLTANDLNIVARAIGYNAASEQARAVASQQYRQMLNERHKPAVQKDLERINDMLLIQRLKGKT